MTLETFLLEYGSILFGSFAVGWASGFFMLTIKRGFEKVT